MTTAMVRCTQPGCDGVSSSPLPDEASLAAAQAAVRVLLTSATYVSTVVAGDAVSVCWPGVVLVCSDGLWDYRPDAPGLAELALPVALSDPPGAAASLVKFALDAGGADNITVVLIPFPPVRPATLPRRAPP